MKILYLYGSNPLDANNIDNTWGTPEGLAYCWKSMGHDVKELNFNAVDLYDSLHQQLQQNPDVVILSHAGTIPTNVQKIWCKQNFQNCLMVAEGCDEPQILQYNLQHTMPADLVWSSDSDAVVWYKQRGKNAYWVMHWGDELVYSYAEDPCNGKISTASGPRQGMWKESVMALKEKFGENFAAPRMNGGPYLSPAANNRLYASTSLAFTVSSNGDITRRIFEAAVAGRMTLCDRLDSSKQFDKIFAEGEDIEFFSTIKELLEKAEYYLNNHEQRIKIANNARKKCLQHHTAMARAQQLLDIFSRHRISPTPITFGTYEK
jgi:hypothetical protein